MCSLCVLVQSETRAIEQLSYILGNKEECTFDNIIDFKIFSFEFDWLTSTLQFQSCNWVLSAEQLVLVLLDEIYLHIQGTKVAPTAFVVAFKCSFVCAMDLQCNCFSGIIAVHFFLCSCEIFFFAMRTHCKRFQSFVNMHSL